MFGGTLQTIVINLMGCKNLSLKTLFKDIYNSGPCFAQLSVPLTEEVIPWLKNCAWNLMVKKVKSTFLSHCIFRIVSDLLQQALAFVWKKDTMTHCDAMQWKVETKINK